MIAPSLSTSARFARLVLPVLLFLSLSSSVCASPESPASPPSSSCSQSTGSASCIGSTSAAAVVALIFVGVVCFFLLLWCVIRILAGRSAANRAGGDTAAFHPTRSFCAALCRRQPTPQVHFHLHATDSPTSLSSSSSPLPWCHSPYPFLGYYRIGRNSHLSAFTLLAHFQASVYPRRLSGSGSDGGAAFSLLDGVWTVEGDEHRCMFREVFEDGSSYLFSGQCGEGVDGRWKGHWWKEGGGQMGVWSMQPDEDKWRAMQEAEEERRRTRENGSVVPAADTEGEVGGTIAGWRERRTPVVVRWELEERKEVGTGRGSQDTSDREQRQRQTAERDLAEVVVEMIALSPQRQQQQQSATPLSVSGTAPSTPLSSGA